MEDFPFVSIVIASFNRKDIIEESISSALNQNYPNNKFEILLVDNNSSDGTIKEVNLLFADQIKMEKIKILPLNYNSGSSGSCIEAIKKINKNWNYILKMDEDIVLDKNCLIEMINVAKQNRIKGMIGGKVLFYKERNKIHAIGSYLKPWYAIAKGIGVNKINDDRFQSNMTLDGVSGCMVLIPKEIYDQVGWFDKDYFLYYDDHDLMYKSNQYGFQHIYTPKAIGYHDTFTGSKKKYANNKWLYYSTRGSLLFLRKNYNKFSFYYFIYLISHNIKFIWGFIYLFYYSKRFEYKKNLNSYFLGYKHGIQNIGGFFDLDNKKLQILIFSGGRGGQAIGIGLQNYANNFNKNLEISYLVNAYDDGKSTGLIRNFFKNTILGPSDVRKIHESSYKNSYNNSYILDFFSKRINFNSSTIAELKNFLNNSINIDIKNQSEILKICLNVPDELKKIIKLSLNNFFKKDYTKVNFNDFAFSNLIYASLSDYYKSLQKAEELIRKALNIQHEVILNSNENGYIFGLSESGVLLPNEDSIVNYQSLSPIYEIFYSKVPISINEIKKFNLINNFEEKKFFVNKFNNYPKLSVQVRNKIINANIIIYAPGTQHSSLYPTYFTKGLSEVLYQSKALKIFITNILHDNEIPGFSASDQLRQAIYYLNEKNKKNYKENQLIDVAIANKPLNEDEKYVRTNLTSLEQLNLKKYIIEKVEHINNNKTTGQHDASKIASLIYNLYYSIWK